MKRALAERAKQSAGLPSSGGTNGGILQVHMPGGSPGSPGSHSLSPDAMMHEQGPPLKIPRHSQASASTSQAEISFPNASASHAGTKVHETSALAGSDGQSSAPQQGAEPSLSHSSSPHPTTISSSSAKYEASQSVTGNAQPAPASSPPAAANPNSMKRPRPSISSQPKVPYPTPSDDENDDSQQTPFFLKHQNRALASELKALQYQLSLLDTERTYRRQQCHMANQALNSLQATWTHMETELQQHQQPLSVPLSSADADTGSLVPQDAPMSTGSGPRVELIGALFDALSGLATQTHPAPAKNEEETTNGEDGEISAALGTILTTVADMEPSEKKQLDDLSTISWNILQRANALEGWIRSLLEKTAGENNGSAGDQATPSAADPVSDAVSQRALVKELGALRGQCSEYKVQIAELAKARDEIAKSERKVRRSIYRLSTGRVKIEQVLKDMEKSDEDGGLAAEAKMEALTQNTSANSSHSKKEFNNDCTLQESQDPSRQQGNGVVDRQEHQNMQKQLEDLGKLLSNRDSSIEQLQATLLEREQRINRLISKALSEDDAEKVQLQEQSQQRLDQVEKDLVDLKDKLKETRENWAKARGDAEAAVKALDDLQSKHKKRWLELTGTSEDSGADDPVDIPLSMEATEQAQKIIELDHKLKQALENVRQADAVRTSLKEALAMNGVLQGKLDEIKGKYAALQASRSNSTNAKLSADATNHSSSSSSHRDKSCEKADVKPEKLEKMQREHRRMRKELAAVAASKDAAKSKLERAEKERDGLMETNARLLKQSAEKDDMNAKSLSTILHLKNLTEKLNQGKISLEQQLKNAGQLSLAARLATNAKDRVTEEVTKEKVLIEKKLENCELRNDALKKELESIVSDWSEADAKISILNSQLSKATERSDELVGDLEGEQKAKRKMQDSLDLAVRKAGDATDKLNEFAKREGIPTAGPASAFTVEQLSTQVGVLKNRLACPVCHFRDKDCIIMRCRHMFCKHCVDENIQNRSRKCPSCGLKFSEKDVDDVWL